MDMGSLFENISSTMLNYKRDPYVHPCMSTLATG